MLGKIDDSFDVCDDFFNFACGNFKPEIPSHNVKIDELGIIQDKLQEQLSDAMNMAVNSSEMDPFRNVKLLYQSCMNQGWEMRSHKTFWLTNICCGNH